MRLESAVSICIFRDHNRATVEMVQKLQLSVTAAAVFVFQRVVAILDVSIWGFSEKNVPCNWQSLYAYSAIIVGQLWMRFQKS